VGNSWGYVDSIRSANEVYGENGDLSRLAWANGGEINFVISDTTTPTSVAPAPGYLIRAQDWTGRSIAFEYAGPRLSLIRNVDGETVSFSYSSSGMLAEVRWSSGSARKFIYEVQGIPSALTGILDEQDRRLSTFQYAPTGVAFATERAGGIARHSTSWNQPPSTVVREQFFVDAICRYHEWSAMSLNNVTVTSPLGSVSSISSTLINGSPVPTSLSQPGGAGCGPASSSITYDSAPVGKG
jgi:uncharacterized protein RhaS with RHS repeats